MRSAALVAALAVLSGCYRGPGAENPEDTRGAPFVPWGIVHRGSLPVDGIAGGIYTSATRSDCCMLAGNATFDTVIPRGARHLYLDVYTIEFKNSYGLTMPPQELTVTLPDGSIQHSGPLKEGFTTIAVALPPSLVRNGGSIHVKVHAAYAFRPSEVLHQTDVRPISLLLRSVDAY